MTGSLASMSLPARVANAPPAGSVSGSSAVACSADADAKRVSAAIAHGDELAFREFYDRYRERVFRLAVVIGHGDEELAKEIVQSVMLTAAAKLKPMVGEEHLWNWLARVTRQQLAKAWRRQQRQPATTDISAYLQVTAIDAADAHLEESLDAALLTLPTEDRQAVEWFYFEHLSHQEIADRTGTTPKAVSSRLERARSRLRALLKRKLSHET
jgi:RNA polymerase sigma-70 factor, ECF subfamily